MSRKRMYSSKRVFVMDHECPDCGGEVRLTVVAKDKQMTEGKLADLCYDVKCAECRKRDEVNEKANKEAMAAAVVKPTEGPANDARPPIDWMGFSGYTGPAPKE